VSSAGDPAQQQTATPTAVPTADPGKALAAAPDVSRGTPLVPTQPLSTLADLPVVSTSKPERPAAPSAGTITVATSYHGWDAAGRAVVVGGYVDGLVESGGTCTLTLTQGQTSLTGTTQAEPDAASTTCGEVAVRDGLTPGAWQAVLSYSSAAHSGSSPAVTVEVP
jgi:hypothetical protein